MENNELDHLLMDDPNEWIQSLPDYQKNIIIELLGQDLDFESIAETWSNASTENTFKFGTDPVVNNNFWENVKKEVRAYLCGDKKYKKERDGLFGEKGIARIFIISAISVSIAPAIGVAAPVVAPLVALAIASIGKVTLNAWCNIEQDQ